MQKNLKILKVRYKAAEKEKRQNLSPSETRNLWEDTGSPAFFTLISISWGAV